MKAMAKVAPAARVQISRYDLPEFTVKPVTDKDFLPSRRKR